MIVLGCDPGVNHFGWGIVSRGDGYVVHVAHGTISPNPKAHLDIRQGYISGALAEIMREFEPDAVVYETGFSRFPHTTEVLGQMRGILKCVAHLARQDMTIYSLAPKEIKLAVAGSGKASKEDMRKAVGAKLNIYVDLLTEDAADALGAALAVGISDQKEAIQCRQRSNLRSSRTSSSTQSRLPSPTHI